MKKGFIIFLKLNPNKNFHIITKLKNIPRAKVESFIENFLSKNLFKKLNNCASLTLLLHNENDLRRTRVIKALDKQVKNKNLNVWGVSLYKPNIAKISLDIKGCKIIQLPFSLFNQSFKKNGMLKEKLKNKKK